MAHDLHHDDAVVAMGGAVQTVDGLGGDAQGGVEAEGDVGQGVLLGAAAQANQAIEIVGLVVGNDGIGHVLEPALHRHLVRLVAAGTEDGAAQGEDARELIAHEVGGAVHHEAAKALAKAVDAHAIFAGGGLADAADGRIEAGAVAAGGEDADGSSRGSFS
jgi:hypothetical protein